MRKDDLDDIEIILLYEMGELDKFLEEKEKGAEEYEKKFAGI